MDKTFDKHGFSTNNFRFLPVKDDIFRLVYNNKFITYIEVTNKKGGGQKKAWVSYQKNLIDYTKQIVAGGSVFDVVCLVRHPGSNPKATNPWRR